MISTLALTLGLAAPVGPQVAVARLQAAHPQARVVWQADRVQLLTGLSVATEGATPEVRVAGFLRAHPELVGLAGALRPAAVERRGARTVVRLKQVHDNRPVLDRAVVVTLDAAGAVISLTNEAQPLLVVREATIDAARAKALVAEATGYAGPMSVKPVVLALGDQGVEGFEIMAGLMVARVDAHAGEVVGVRKGWMD